MIPKEMIESGSAGDLIRDAAQYASERELELGSENVFDFSMGSPSVEPPAVLHNTLRKLMADIDPVKLHAYTADSGIYEVRAEIAEHLRRSYGVEYTARDIFMTSGASSALAILMRSLLSPGNEIIVLPPYFSEYAFFCRAAGGVVVEVPCDSKTFQPDIEAIAKAINVNTAAVVLNSPNNPSGAIYTEDTIRRLGALLEQRAEEYGHPICIIADEPYRDLAYDGIEVPFIPSIYRNTFYCYSFSKALSIPGDRVGFIAVTPNIDEYDVVLDAIRGAAMLLGHICLPPMLQLAIASCLEYKVDMDIYDKNRRFIYEALTAMGFDCVHPDGAFYLFIRSPDGNSLAFCENARKKNIVLIPGEEFTYPGYVRLAYCVPTDRLERSVPFFKELASEYGL